MSDTLVTVIVLSESARKGQVFFQVFLCIWSSIFGLLCN